MGGAAAPHKQKIKSMMLVSHLVKKVTTVITVPAGLLYLAFHLRKDLLAYSSSFLCKALKRGQFSHQTALGTLTAGCHITINWARGRDQTVIYY